MIVTPEHIIKKHFPEPIETTRDLYAHLDFDEYVYPYVNWLKDAEKHCLSKYVNESEYKLLPDSETNYWISEKAFRILIETSPSKIGDEIRNCVAYISQKVATDPVFARQLQDQLDQEAGIVRIIPKASKTLKSNYNRSGQDAFEFSVKEDNRLYMNIISGYNFQPGQKIKDAGVSFRFLEEDGVPFHIIDIVLSLTNEHTLSYRTVWCCREERQRYGAILMNGIIRVNLFEDNKKLVDSFDYIWSPSELKNLELDLEKALSQLLEIDLSKINLKQLGEKILLRYNLNDQAYALAVKALIPTMAEYASQGNADTIDSSFLKAVDQYWKYYVLQPDPTILLAEDLEQMTNDRIPRVTLALTVANMLDYGDLCEKYFKHRFSSNQKEALLRDGTLRLIYTLAEATEFDASAPASRQLVDMCAFIAEHLDFMKQMLIQAGQWPST